MNIDGTPTARLRKLEAVYRAPRDCETCYGHPVRLAYADPGTGETWHETMPADGCPACGRPILSTRRILIPDDGSGEPPI